MSMEGYENAKPLYAIRCGVCEKPIGIMTNIQFRLCSECINAIKWAKELMNVEVETTEMTDDSDKYKNDKKNIEIIINYLEGIKEKIDNKNTKWIDDEIHKLKSQRDRLMILGTTDEDIISVALMNMSNIYRERGDFKIADKISDVRKRYLNSIIKVEKND